MTHRSCYYVKGKSISDKRSVENISGKRLRIEVRPAQTNGVESVKRFLNVHLNCIVSNLKRISKISILSPPGKISADANGWTDFDLMLRSQSVVLFGSIILSHSKSINAKVVNFFCPYSKPESQTRGPRRRFVRPAMIFGNFQIINIYVM